MSFSFRIIVEEGKPAVDAGTVSGNIPDGSFVLTGHDDAAARSLAVSRQGPDGLQDMSVYGGALKR